MTDSSNANLTSTPQTKKKGGGGGAFFIFVLVLVVVAGGIGFGTGFTQTFAPVEGGIGFLHPTLKNQYFIQSSGTGQSPFTITVTVNGNKAATISTREKIVDITDYVLKGRNKVVFEAKKLSKGMFDDSSVIDVAIVEGKRAENGYKDGQDLVRYERSAKDDLADYKDEMDWEPLNE